MLAPAQRTAGKFVEISAFLKARMQITKADLSLPMIFFQALNFAHK